MRSVLLYGENVMMTSSRGEAYRHRHIIADDDDDDRRPRTLVQINIIDQFRLINLNA